MMGGASNASSIGRLRGDRPAMPQGESIGRETKKGAQRLWREG
jgi:hypothetical protein